METKPTTYEGYRGYDPRIVRSTCLYVATKLGDYLEDVVVIGGLVPSLLVDQSQSVYGFEIHAGTMDLDIGLSLAILEEKRYEEIRARLQESGFEPEVNEKGNPSHQTWRTNFDPPVTIDFLIPSASDEERGGTLKHIAAGFAAWINEGLHLAFIDRRKVVLSGFTPLGERATREIWVCGPGAFTALKALAFRGRGTNKDAYDLTYIWRYLGIDEVARCLIPHVEDYSVKTALSIVREDFTTHNSIGAMRAAEFIHGRPDDDIQADVVGLALGLLDALNAN